MDPKSKAPVPPTGNTGNGIEVNRRQFLRATGIGSLAMLTSPMNIMAGPFADTDFANPAFEALVPADKKLDPAWVKSLFARGTPTTYRGDELKHIGMPVGGIGAGQLYLGGDGKLWLWDIFNHAYSTGTDGHNYAKPLLPSSPLEQGFALDVTRDGTTTRHTLDRKGFTEVVFRGEYPIGTVTYRDPAVPLSVSLEGFSPFIPLSTDDSSMPATVMRFTVSNHGTTACDARMVGWLENAVCLHHRTQVTGTRTNRIVRGEGFTFLACSAAKAEQQEPVRPQVTFEDWNKEIYAGWTSEGTAFGKGPIKRSDMPAYMGNVGGDSERVVNSHATAPGTDVGAKDGATGRLISRTFLIERHFINVWIGGGHIPGKTCLNVVVGDQVVASISGRNDNRMSLQSINVRELAGKEAHLEIVDDFAGGWGNVGVGSIVFSDTPAMSERFEALHDHGDMGLALVGAAADHAVAALATAADSAPGDNATVPLAEKLVGELGRRLRLAPGQSAVVEFVIAWRFPNLTLPRLGPIGRHYGDRFASAQAVAAHVVARLAEFTATTRLWRDTWYDSTLPYWFLDRTLLNISILATSTSFRCRGGRFYGWEGVGCCEGTCTHVWQYEQAMGRLFPELDIALREKCDFDPAIAFDPVSGVIGHRGESLRSPAVDGQAGTILRTYRDHQMSPDDTFLKRNWASIKKATEWLIHEDVNGDGVLEGAQHNTLDAAWFGAVPWLSGLYLAALRASEEMATEVGDAPFATRCRAILDASRATFVKRMFNGEYFIQVSDPAHRNHVGSYDGCEIDQVYGQQWAFQVGLGRILPEKETRAALGALWKYNFTPDVGPYRKVHKPGRWYAMAGEGGLLMCTFPNGEASRVKTGFDYYFNECMTGFEHEVAAHMIWEGMTLEGLAIERTIHDRYHAARRNPWNEVECGDHYARAMASYGVHVAACGYEYHGPKRHLGFAPRLSPEHFKAAFTAAEGWGSYQQRHNGIGMEATIAIAHGRIGLATVSLVPPDGSPAVAVSAKLDGKPVVVTSARNGDRVLLTFAETLVISAGQKLDLSIT